MYRAARDQKYRIDGSVWYLYSRSAVERIEREAVQARYIVCLRDHVEMFFSLHSQLRFVGRERYADPKGAWLASKRRAMGKRDGIYGLRQGDVRCMAYTESCRLGAQVADLLHRVDSTRVLFLWLDDLRRTPQLIWSQLLEFLDLDAFPMQITVKNPRKEARWQILNRGSLIYENIKKRMGIRFHTGILRRLHAANVRISSGRAADNELERMVSNYFERDRVLLRSSLESVRHYQSASLGDIE
jgi:hypothetical protein